jgi:hypothetical protein
MSAKYIYSCSFQDLNEVISVALEFYEEKKKLLRNDPPPLGIGKEQE